jgi:tetratricopeptide (TPR) repeat protein
MKIDKQRLGKVVAVYASASFVVLQVVDLFQDRLALPDWLFLAALVLLIVGLPIIIATALVQDNEFKSQLVERHFTWSKAIGGGVVALIALVVVAALFARDRFGGDEKLDANLVAVFPFRVSGAEPSLHYLADGMVDLLAAKLSGDAGPRAADARTALAAWRRIDAADPEPEQLIRAARSIGARRLMVGEIVGNANQLTISGSVTDTRTGRRVQHLVSGRADELPTKVDELAAVLLSLDAGEPRDRLASLTSTALPAVRAYLLGEDQYRRAHYGEAVKHYRTALEADSTFALPALGIVAAATWNASMPVGTLAKARRIAWINRSKLSELDQLKLVAYMGDRYPMPTAEVPLCLGWDKIIQRAPDRAEAWHNKADCVYHHWKFMGLERTKAHDDARKWFEKSLALDSSFLPNIQHLVPLAAARGDAQEVRRLADTFLGQDSTSQVARLMKWFVHYTNGNKEEVYRLDSTYLAQSSWVLEYADDHALADSVLTLTLLEIRKRSATGNLPAGTIGADVLRGRLALAIAHADTLDAKGGHSGALSALGHRMYADWDSADAVRRKVQLEKFTAAPVPNQEGPAGQWHFAHCLLEQSRLWNGDASRTDQIIALMTAQKNPPDFATGMRYANRAMCAQMLKAIRATVQKRPEAKQLAFSLDSLNAGFPQYGAHSNYLRLVVARLLELNGEIAAARTAVSRAPTDMPLLQGVGAELLHRARLSAKLGDRQAAIHDYRKYLAFRSRPDAAGLRQTQQARRELQALLTE